MSIIQAIIKSIFLPIVVEKAISNRETKKVSEEDRALFHRIPSAEPHLIKTSDGQTLEAIFVPSSFKDGRQAVFICSGGLESHELHSFPIAKAYYDLGFNVAVFNYRGFGKSTGSPTEEGLILDAEAVYLFLTDKGFHPHEILGHGYSLGGGVVAALASSRALDIVIDRSFVTFSDIVHNYMRKKRINWLFRACGKMLANACFPLNTLERLKRCRGKVFIFRGKKDISMSAHDLNRLRKVIEEHTSPELFTLVEADVGHFHDENPVWMDPSAGFDQAREAWLSFLKKHERHPSL